MRILKVSILSLFSDTNSMILMDEKRWLDDIDGSTIFINL